MSLPPSTERVQAEPPRGAGWRIAGVLVRLRWWVVLFWAVATLAALVLVPSLGVSRGGDGLDGLVPSDSPAIRAELRSFGAFKLPLLARTVLVQRDPGGLSPYAQARSVTNAFAVNRGKYDVAPLLGALPVSNTLGLFPGAAENNTTALTYLFFRPELSFGRQARSARAYANEHFGPRDHVVGITGSVPARGQQGRIIRANLSTVEMTTLAAVILIVGLSFRSVIAPVLALCTTAVAYVLTLHLTGLLAQVLGISIPSELEPVILALLLGVVTDYVVFFLASLRHELRVDADPLVAARVATAQFLPIIATAGLAVAAGAGALLVASSAFFRTLGPALTLTVLIGVGIAVTLIPALMAILGSTVFWPRRPHPDSSAPVAKAPSPVTHTLTDARRLKPFVILLTQICTNRRAAAATLTVCVIFLVGAALPLLHLGLGVSFVNSLPSSNRVSVAANGARAGFAAGILSPTVVLLQGSDVTAQRDGLRVLEAELQQQAGVAGVLGPGDLPARLEGGILQADSGDAARFLVILSDQPLGAAGVATINNLQEHLPELLRRSGLEHASAALAGDSATAAYIVQETEHDVVKIALAALLANLVMLLLFLRALVVSIFLLVSSLLSLAASLGLTTWVFAQTNPGDGLTFYVPFTAAVLLLAFGSDYNIFGVGHIWDEARGRALSSAIIRSMTRTTPAIVAAGLALAASFGLLAVVPLLPFRQLALAMALGILLDVFVVRSLLMPALLTLLGPIGAWPSRRPPISGEESTPPIGH